MARANYSFYIGKGHEKAKALLDKLSEEKTLGKFLTKIIEENMPECFDEKIKEATEELEFWKRLRSDINNRELKEKQKLEFLSMAEEIIRLPRWKLKLKSKNKLEKDIQALRANLNLDGAKEQLAIIKMIIEEKNGE